MTEAIDIAIKEFERLKSAATSLKDVVYLDGVLAVLDSVKIKSKDNKAFGEQDLKAAFEAGRIADHWSDEKGWTTNHTFPEWFKVFTRKE